MVAIKDINLTIEDGDIFGVIGLSGAGKSTLIRCINFLEKPTEGQVIFDGVDPGQPEAFRASAHPAADEHDLSGL